MWVDTEGEGGSAEERESVYDSREEGREMDEKGECVSGRGRDGGGVRRTGDADSAGMGNGVIILNKCRPFGKITVSF